MEGVLAHPTHEEDGEDAVKDAALISAAQKVEHYEIAGYGCARTYARLLGYSDAEALLQETLKEEGAADKKLTELAETIINVEAAENDEEESEEESEEADDEDLGAAAKGSNGSKNRSPSSRK